MGGPLEHPRRRDFWRLDPENGQPGYWDAFRAGTMTRVEPELARRRRRLETLTVSDVVTGWSGTVVPLAMAAAAAALVVLLTAPTRPAPSPRVATVDAEAVIVDGGPIPLEAEPADPPIILTVAGEGF